MSTYWSFASSSSVAYSIDANSASATASATASGSDSSETTNLAIAISNSESEKLAIQLLKDSVASVSTTELQSIVSLLNNITYYVPNLKKVSSWEGSKPYTIGGKGQYLFTGNGLVNDQGEYDGQIYLGNVEAVDATNYYTIKFPEASITACYNGFYDTSSKLYSFCGNFKTPASTNSYGYLYNGSLSATELINPNNFTIIQPVPDFKITICHDVTGPLTVGNSQTAQGFQYSFMYNSITKKYREISHPLSLTTSTYGIWQNSSTSYTIVGGYSTTKKVPFNVIYPKNSPGPNPYGLGYIADYDLTSDTFSNWTTINLFGQQDEFSHCQGISSYFNQKNIYTLNYFNKLVGETQSYILKIQRENNTFTIVNNRQIYDINYGGTTTASNSVANNVIVGITYAGAINPETLSTEVPYQCIVQDF